MIIDCYITEDYLVHMKRHIDKIKDATYERGYVYNVNYHLIWCTKYRRECFTDEDLVNEMKKIIFDIAEISDIEIKEIEVMPDHIHLLVSFKPKYSITDVVKNIKGYTARIFLSNHSEIRDNQFWGGKLWSASYYVGTVGNMSKETIQQYIQNQYKK